MRKRGIDQGLNSLCASRLAIVVKRGKRSSTRPRWLT